MTTAATISARLTLDSSEFNRNTALAEQRIQAFSNKMKSIGSSLTQIGGMMTRTFTLPIVAGAALAGKAYSDLDTQIRNIQSITGQTDAEMQVMRQTFIDLSTDLTKTRDNAVSLAEGFYFIQSAGFAGADGMEVLQVSTKAASAGLTETMVAGNAILAVLNAYGLEAKDAAYVSDVLFKTVDVGVLTFEDLASQLGDVVSTASMTDTSIDVVGAAMALMTRKGISASESVTALNQLLLQFISPSTKMKKAAKNMGIELDVSMVRTLGLAGALDEIKKKGGGADALLTLFGDNVRALKAALALGGTEGEFADMLGEFQDVTGRTQEAFATQTQSTAAKWDNFLNKLTAMGLRFADVFVPILLELADAVAPWIDKLTQADPALIKWITIIALAVAVIGPLLLLLGGMATAIGAIASLVTAIGLPVIGIILAVVAVLALLYLAWTNNWGGIQEKTAAVIGWIQSNVTEFLTFIHNLTSGKLGDLSQLWYNTWGAISIFFTAFTNNLKLLFAAFQAAWNGDWYRFGELMRTIWENAWTAITNILKLAWSNVQILFRNLWTNLMNWFQSINWGVVGHNIIVGIANGLSNASGYVFTALRNIGQAMLQAWQGFWGMHSPSTVMYQQSEMIAAGANMGVEDNLAFSPDTISRQVSMSLGVGVANSDNTSSASQPTVRVDIDYDRLAEVISQELQKVL